MTTFTTRGLEVEVSGQQGVGRLRLRGNFDFASHRDFRAASERAMGLAADRVELDLEGVDYLDSAALGMLLVLEDDAKERRQKIAIVSCSETARAVLEVANLERLLGSR